MALTDVIAFQIRIVCTERGTFPVKDAPVGIEISASELIFSFVSWCGDSVSPCPHAPGVLGRN